MVLIRLAHGASNYVDYTTSNSQLRGKLNWAAQNALVQACGHGSKVGEMRGFNPGFS